MSGQLAASSAQHGRAVEEREAVHKVTWFNYPHLYCAPEICQFWAGYGISALSEEAAFVEGWGGKPGLRYFRCGWEQTRGTGDQAWRPWTGLQGQVRMFVLRWWIEGIPGDRGEKTSKRGEREGASGGRADSELGGGCLE